MPEDGGHAGVCVASIEDFHMLPVSYILEEAEDPGQEVETPMPSC